MGPIQAQFFFSGVLADRESPEQPFVALNKDQFSQTHVRLTGVPTALVAKWLTLGRRVTPLVPLNSWGSQDLCSACI